MALVRLAKSLILNRFRQIDSRGTSSARREVRADPVTIRKAQGFALIDLIFVCGVIGVLCSIALPRLLMARQSASTASAIASMRVINSSQLTYALTCGSGFYAPNLTTLGTPPPGSHEPFISVGLGAADTVTKSGYVITMSAATYPGSPASCNGLGVGLAGQGFSATADPTEPSNFRFFGTNASNIIYENTSTLAGSMTETGPPPIGQMVVH
jgi:type II secretory pathway pseudopilin PulG